MSSNLAKRVCTLCEGYSPPPLFPPLAGLNRGSQHEANTTTQCGPDHRGLFGAFPKPRGPNPKTGIWAFGGLNMFSQEPSKPPKKTWRVEPEEPRFLHPTNQPTKPNQPTPINQTKPNKKQTNPHQTKQKTNQPTPNQTKNKPNQKTKPTMSRSLSPAHSTPRLPTRQIFGAPGVTFSLSPLAAREAPARCFKGSVAQS